MFQPGDVIQRKPEYYDGFWSCYCHGQGVPIDHVFYVIVHRPERETVRFNGPLGEPYGVFDYKMELANFSLENE